MKSTIFYTDDDSDDTMLFKQVLNEINPGHDVVTLEDGEELIDRLNNPPPTPNLIFLDLNMPGKDGRETLKEIKAHENFKKFHIIILSTSSSQEDIDYTYQHGAALFITKPSDYAQLKKVLAMSLNKDWMNFEKADYGQFYINVS